MICKKSSSLEEWKFSLSLCEFKWCTLSFALGYTVIVGVFGAPNKVYYISGSRIVGSKDFKRSVVKVCGDRRDMLSSLMPCSEGL